MIKANFPKELTVTPDLLASPNLPQAAVMILATVTFALFAWLPVEQPQTVKAECDKPLYLPTASDAPPYSWEWPLQETDEPRRRRHRRG